MRAPLWSWAILLIMLAVGATDAQEAITPTAPRRPSAPLFSQLVLRLNEIDAAESSPVNPGLQTTQGKGEEKGKEKGKEKDPKDKPPIEPKQPVDPFAQERPERGTASRGFNPHMIGDLPAPYSLQVIVRPGNQIVNAGGAGGGGGAGLLGGGGGGAGLLGGGGGGGGFGGGFGGLQGGAGAGGGAGGGGVGGFQGGAGSATTSTSSTTVVTRVPLGALGAIKIGENQSPMPSDRAFFTYNYYSDVRGPNGPASSVVIGQVIPGAPSPGVDLHRVSFGVEKTILDGNASVGLRLPLFDVHGNGTFSQSDIGDLSLIFNYAFCRDADTGNVLSGGLMVTLPTGPGGDTIAGNINPTLFQPFIGYRLNLDDFYVHGFSSVAIPTDGRVVTAMFNDIGFGYWLYRGDCDRRITAIIPTLEFHITTPLDHRQVTDLVTLPDIVALTGGVHVGLGSRALLTVGITTPITGPRPWDVEAVMQFNFRF